MTRYHSLIQQQQPKKELVKCRKKRMLKIETRMLGYYVFFEKGYKTDD